MRHNPLRLSVRHRRWFYLTIAILVLTGVAWLSLHLWNTRVDPDAPPHPAEPWLMKVHGAAAMVALLVLGAMVPLHVRRGWRAKVNRFSGAIMVAVTGALIVTGYGLYYCGSERLRAVIAWSHDAVGIALPILIVWHVVQGRRRSRQAR